MVNVNYSHSELQDICKNTAMFNNFRYCYFNCLSLSVCEGLLFYKYLQIITASCHNRDGDGCFSSKLIKSVTFLRLPDYTTQHNVKKLHFLQKLDR